MDRYPPYRILFIALLIIAPVLLFISFNTKDRSTQLLTTLGLVEYSGVSPVPMIAERTRKGPDLPVPIPKEEPIFTDTLTMVVFEPPSQSLEFPDGDTTKFYSLYRKLKSVPRDSISLNILHFGDSQLEEDRITRYFRSRMMSANFPFETGGSIRVVNLPKRGSAGIDLIEVGGEPLQQILAAFPPDLILFEFGINVVRARTHDFSYYTRLLVKQIQRFRELCREVPILIIGVSEMADRSGSQIVPLTTVPFIRNAQREAAHLTGSAFWDLFAMMGGSGSVIHWYMSDPQLIREDLTHFSFVGGERVADELFKAIIWDMQNFVRSTQ